MMDLHPWNYWKEDGEPQPWTPKILRVLESVMGRNPDHPGANHLYIYAVEAEQPGKALPRSQPAATTRTRRGPFGAHAVAYFISAPENYHEGTLANERAVQADNAYVTQCRQQDIYPLAYVPHNYHFLWATATMEGRAQRSIEAAQQTADLVNTQTMRELGLGTLQHYWMIPLYGYMRFAKWDEILAHPKPDQDLIYPLGVWHYARGMAYIGKNEVTKAEAELEKLKVIAADDTLEAITIWDINTTQHLMQIAANVLEGEVEAKMGNFDKAIALLREAAKIEDSLTYNEPPDWFFPVRHNLGSILIEAGKPAEAEEIYRQDFKKFPDNGWSLYGLWKSLEAQEKSDEAAQTKQKFDNAWQHADVELTASRIM